MTKGYPKVDDISQSSPPKGEGQIGAVVVGGDFQGLGIIRSLGRHGVPVCVVDDEASIGRFSRHATLHAKAPDLRDPRASVDFLIHLAKQRGLLGWVLFPTRDELVTAFSQNRDVLMEHFRLPTPGWETIKWASNKQNTCALAKDLGIPLPKTWCPGSLEEAESLQVEFPVCIKPAVKENFFYATKAKAWRANNRQELINLFRRALDIVTSHQISVMAGSKQILIQEMIPGDGQCQFSSCMFFKDGEVIASLEARRSRQHPHEFGRASTFVETVDLPKLREFSIRFLRAVNYYGLVELEYKLDLRDGQYKLLDVNTRTWGHHTLGAAAGVDFSYLLYADQVGYPLERCQGRPGVAWIRMATDLPTSIADLVTGRLGWHRYVDSLRRSNVEAVYSRDDLLPSVMEIAMLPYLMLKKGF